MIARMPVRMIAMNMQLPAKHIGYDDDNDTAPPSILYKHIITSGASQLSWVFGGGCSAVRCGLPVIVVFLNYLVAQTLN